MTIDPSDDCTFWYTTEYLLAANDKTNKWSTRVGNFRFPSCGASRVPAKLVFETEPGPSYAAGGTITVKVAIEDNSSKVVPSDTSAITLVLQNGAGGAVLSGTNPVNAVAGVATFNVSVNLAGTGYTLHATDGGLTPADSTAFAVVAGAAATITFAQGPLDTIAGAANLGTSGNGVVVHVQDAGSNPIVGDTVTLAVASGPGNMTVTNGQATDSNGNATFADAVITAAGAYTLSATDSGALAATSSSFMISPAAPQLVFTTQPTDVVQGSTLNTIAVTKQDQYGNVYSADTDQVDFTVASCGGVTLGSANLDGSTGTATLSSPQRFYTGVANPPGLQVTAHDSTVALTDVQSSLFAVTANGDILLADGFDGCRP
jgi:hypothetical protein